MIVRYAIAAFLIAIAAVAIGGAAGHFAPQIDAAVGEKAAEPVAEAKPVVVYSGTVQIGRAADSHFYADAEVDGASLRMVVDSGASSVVLTRADAEAAGINVAALPIGGSAQTAGGTVPIRPVVLRRVTVGDVDVRGVQAVVIDTEMPHSLLGQSFLSRLDAVSVEGDMMTLR